ncbi:hypothetical protein QFZ63_000159 [Streptomyces sp. B3I7]|uniref:DUF4913 domain-containing protein n=1 Tax=Streptomyces sp. B3I7 TaxID=3042269 RepID=UPI002782342F|nr:DUF4913 domain-containing protein [Streptomyces sp. B3I7]MDQ0808445.1 hypothetical protein [Streptomyces sp. B3I7]
MTTWEGDFELAPPLAPVGPPPNDAQIGNAANPATEPPNIEAPLADIPSPPVEAGTIESEEQQPYRKPQFILYLEDPERSEAIERLVFWVHYLVLPVYADETSSSAPWCPRWWEHTKAVTYLYALWMAWQELTDFNGGLTGPAVWHRDFLAPTMAILRDPSGPFAGCKEGSHQSKEPPVVDQYMPYPGPEET